FLTRTKANGNVAKELAVAWKPNKDASKWTVSLRPNVKFQSGTTLGAADVIATYKNLLAKNSQAISAYNGVLSPGGVVKGKSDLEVIFNLDNPTASFPYLISSTTYQAIILPADYKVGTFTSKAQGTGAYMITGYNPGVSATYDPFDGWWGGKAPMAG